MTTGQSTQTNRQPLVPGRECGDCIACCVVLLIDTEEFKKPADAKCRHCSGTGCGIYSSRPEVCRTYYCLWRTSPVLAEEHRPDRVGILFQIVREEQAANPFRKHYLLGIAGEKLPNLTSPAMTALLAPLKKHRVPVWIQFGSRAVCVHPSPAVQSVVARGNPPPDETIAAEAAAWLTAMSAGSAPSS